MTSWIFFILLAIASINYLCYVAMDKAKHPFSQKNVEGFEDSETKKDQFLENDSLYDKFYVSIYDELSQNMKRTQGKIALLLNEWKTAGAKPEDMIVLDAGTGTGLAAFGFAKMNVKKIIAVDNSAAMIEYAEKTNRAAAKLTEKQKESIEFRVGDLMTPSLLEGSSITHAVAFYFTFYELADQDAFFRNTFHWVKPGGSLSIEVVNKHKFDPMLESASPWIGFSLQKYSKDRVTESKVTFNNFTYKGKFDLTDPKAEFRETFRFKDGRVRRQKHSFQMDSLADIVKSAISNGWIYKKSTDLTMIGFEYAYILSFRHP